MINIKEYINRIIQYHLDQERTIIVLKGIDIKLVQVGLTIDIEEILKNKLNYF